MRTDTAGQTTEPQIRALINSRVEAVRAKDLEGALADHSPDIVLYDALNPLQYRGVDEARKRTAEWFNAYDGPIGFEIRDLAIASGDDVAFCHFLYHVSGAMTNGTKVDMWVRSTVCYRKLEGKWLATHEHASVPFDVESGQASTNLKP